MVKRFLASLMALFVFVALLPAATVVAAGDTPGTDEQTIDLSGEWHFKYYRKYNRMFQYGASSTMTWEDLDAALLPSRETWMGWETVTMPYENLEEDAGGLLPLAMFPSWSEAWVVKEFEVGPGFTQDETVTLLLGIIDDIDIVYINGEVVAGSGFKDGNDTPTLNVPDIGGFVYSLPAGRTLEQGQVQLESGEQQPGTGTGENAGSEADADEEEPLSAPAQQEPEAVPDVQPVDDEDEEAAQGAKPVAEESSQMEAANDEPESDEADSGEPVAPIQDGDDAAQNSTAGAQYEALPQPFAAEPVLLAAEADGDVDPNTLLFKFEASYWEVQREYEIPASVLHTGTNTIAIRVYNNNGNGGFYSEWPYALCGSEKAVRLAKGLPTNEADDGGQALMQAVLQQQAKALADGNLGAYAATIWEDYDHNGKSKQGLVDETGAMLDAYSAILITDESPAYYVLDDGGYYYEAQRTLQAVPKDGGDNVTLQQAGPVSQYFVKLEGSAGAYMLERGSRSHCYTVEYESGLFPVDVDNPEKGGQTLQYGIYLPPSYYDEPDREYPVVYLLHGINSSHSSFINVDGIEQSMNKWIAAGDIMEMIVVMPDSGKNSFYRDSAYDPKNHETTGPWRTHITDEIRAEVESNYRTMNDAKYRGLTGISMGGGGAWSIGLERRDLYSSIASHMGALGSALSNLRAVDDDVLYTYDFYLDCGYQDSMVSWRDTQNAHLYLEERGIGHGYDLRDGGHNSAFYMAGMPYSMQMHSNNFARNMAGYEKKAVNDAAGGLRLRGDVESGAVLEVKELAAGSEAFNLLRTAKPAGTVLAKAWDISLSKGFSGELQLTFTGLEEYEGQEVVMVHGLAAGGAELLRGTVQDGELTVTVTSLSPFGLAVPGYDPVDPIDPIDPVDPSNPGDNSGGDTGSGGGTSGPGTGSTDGGASSQGGGGSPVSTGDVSLAPYLAAAGISILLMLGLVVFVTLRRRTKQDTE